MVARTLVLIAAVALIGSCAKAPPAATAAQDYAYRAQLSLQQGDYYGAWNLYRRSFDRASMYGDLRGQSLALLNMAELAYQSFLFSKSDSLLVALPPETAGDSDVALLSATIQLKVGAARGSCGAASTAPPVEVAGAKRARWNLAAAECARANGDLHAARQLVDQAHELYGNEGAGQLLLARAALASAAGAHAEASPLLEEALLHAQKGRLPHAIGEILMALGENLEAVGQREAAARHYDRALKLYQQLQLTLPYLRASQSWLRTTSEATEEQRAAFEQLRSKQSGADLDAALK